MPSTAGPLRIGLLLDEWTVPRWVDDIVRAIEGSSYGQVVLVVLAVPEAAAERGSFLGRIWRHRALLGYLAIDRMEQRRSARAADPWAPRDLRELLGGVPVMSVDPIRTRYSDRFPEADLQAIAGHDLDVALRFGFRILRGGVLEIARHGVWSFHHGDNRLYRGGPAGAWEVLEQNPVTGAVLQVLTESLDGGRVLGRVTTATDRQSIYRNRRALYERAWPMMPRLLERLHATGRLEFERPQMAYDRRLYQGPSNLQAARAVLGFAGRMVAARLDRAVAAEQWQLAYRIGDEEPAAFRFEAIEPPPDRDWADPFAVETADGYVVFFEEVIFPRPGEPARGWISALQIDRDGHVGPAVKVLEEPHHLSYPLVFSWREDWYMLPESAEAGRVTLYRATRFPDAWEPCTTLLDGIAGIDSTMAEIDDHWWLWVTLRVPGTATADETLLFHAASPLGPFVPHPANPVATDVRNARGAGRPFLHDGRWIRPAQDGSGRYGRAIVFMAIDRLDPTTYAESEVARIEPRWDRSIVGTHTYNRAGRLQVIDVIRRRSRLRPSTGRGPRAR